MKKILVVILLLLLVTGCGKKAYIPINYDELMKKVDSKENFVLLVGSDTCGACQTLKPKLNKVIAKYNLDVYYYDIQKNQQDINNIVRFEGTPTLAFIKNGKEESPYNRIEDGNATSKELIEIFKKNKYIEGE